MCVYSFAHPTAISGVHRIHYWGLSRTVLTHTLTGCPTDPESGERPWGKAVQSYYDITQPNYALPEQLYQVTVVYL